MVDWVLKIRYISVPMLLCDNRVMAWFFSNVVCVSLTAAVTGVSLTVKKNCFFVSFFPSLSAFLCCGTKRSGDTVLMQYCICVFSHYCCQLFSRLLMFCRVLSASVSPPVLLCFSVSVQALFFSLPSLPGATAEQRHGPDARPPLPLSLPLSPSLQTHRPEKVLLLPDTSHAQLQQVT